jgi:hypothetical protein
MENPNPYESPREPEPRPRAQPLRRTLGVSIIILLTPPAVFIAVGATCGIPAILPSQMPVYARVAFPIFVLAALMVLAGVFDRPTPGDRNAAFRRLNQFLAVPVLVSIAAACGALLAIAFVYSEPRWTLRFGEGSYLLIAFAIFWLPPALTLGHVLVRAWRAK